MKQSQSSKHENERSNKDRKQLANKSTMSASSSNYSNQEVVIADSNCVVQQKIKASKKQVTKQKMFTRINAAPSKLTFLDESSISQEPTPKMFRSTNKTGKRLTKTDLVRVQKKISSYAKQFALDLENGETLDKDAEHKIVFDWFTQSAAEMLTVMNIRL